MTVRGASAAVRVTAAAVAATGDAATETALVGFGDNNAAGTAVVAAGTGSVGTEATTRGALPDGVWIWLGDKAFRRVGAPDALGPPRRCPADVPGSAVAAGAGSAE